MKRLYILTLTFLSLSLTSCSWLSSFYIINKTNENIIITYSLKPTGENDYAYALKDTIEFEKLNNDLDVDDKDLVAENTVGEFTKTYLNGLEIYSATIAPKTAISSGRRIPFFTYSKTDERHRIFRNVIEMKIIRLDTRDTVILKPSLLADFSREFGKYDIALIFD